MIDFNPRTREGCDGGQAPYHDYGPISTHAPVKGATDDGETRKTLHPISTHAPVKGATGRRRNS